MTPARRATFVGLAGVLIPGDGAMPAAGGTDIGGALLDRALDAAPRLRDPLAMLLDEVAGEPPAEAVVRLEGQMPAAFEILLLAVFGAYLLDAQVREGIGYHGQEAEGLPRGGFGGEEYLEGVLDRGRRYREAPL